MRQRTHTCHEQGHCNCDHLQVQLQSLMWPAGEFPYEQDLSRLWIHDGLTFPITSQCCSGVVTVLITTMRLQVSTTKNMQDCERALLPSGHGRPDPTGQQKEHVSSQQYTRAPAAACSQVISQRSFPPRTGERLLGEYLRCGEREPRRLSRGERERRDRSGVSARRRRPTGERPRYRPLSSQSCQALLLAKRDLQAAHAVLLSHKGISTRL